MAIQKAKYFINQIVDFHYNSGDFDESKTADLSGKIIEIAILRRSLLEPSGAAEYTYKILTFGTAPQPLMWVLEEDITKGGRIVRSSGKPTHTQERDSARSAHPVESVEN